MADRDLVLSGGRLRVRTHGPQDPAGDVPVLCVPGLSSNLTSFEPLGRVLSARGRRVVAFDLRGRGRSDATPTGTYGWDAHARDLLDAATALGAGTFDLVGHSMGAYVGMLVAAEHPERVRSLTLIDGAGRTDPSTVGPITDNLQRLDRWHESEEAYLELMREAGLAAPWSDAWETFYRYELQPGVGGVRPTTSLPAVMEDIAYAGGVDQRTIWPELPGPTLLVRATLPLGGTGHVVSKADAEAFAASATDATVVEVEANHFGVLFDDATIRAIDAFLP